MLPTLEGKTAVITGAARGLGLLVAADLAAEGVRVCGLDVRAPELSAAMTGIRERCGVETLAVTADLADEQQVADGVRQIIDRFGSIDILVNNAGIRDECPVHETSADLWDRIQDVNIRGQFLCTREVLRRSMLPRNAGTIIFVSSGSGKKGEENCSAYCSSKWAMMGFAESVAKELKDTRIRVSNVVPGMIWTPMAAESPAANLGLKWLDPKWVSQAILFCIKQDTDTIIPELRIYHRAQI